MTSIETTTVAPGADSITNITSLEGEPTHKLTFVLVGEWYGTCNQWFYLQQDYLRDTGLKVTIADGSGAKGVGGGDFTYAMVYDVTAPNGADFLVAVAPGIPEDGWKVTVATIDGEEQAEYTLPENRNTVHRLA